MDITPLTSGLINSLLAHEILATAEDVADILWLSLYLAPEMENVEPTLKVENNPSSPKKETNSVSSSPSESLTSAGSVHLYSSPSVNIEGENDFSGHEEKLLLTGTSALPHKLEIGRLLRMLAKKIPSTTKFVVDELATVQLMADTGSLSMVYAPEKERWLNGILVVDSWPSMLMWEQTIYELEQLFTQLGLFHTLRKYRLITDEKKFTTHLSTFGFVQKLVEPHELIDLTQRSVIFVISDCYSPAWSNGEINQLLAILGQQHHVVIFNVLPEIQWLQTALSTARRVYVQSVKPNSPNTHFQIDDPLKGVFDDDENCIAWPIITLEPDYIEAWVKFFDGDTQIALPGYQLAEDDHYIFHKTAFPRFDTQLWQHFRATTSLTARELTGYLAAVPLTLPIMRLVQHMMLPHSHQGHLAEILNSHLVRLVSDPTQVTHPNQLIWDFIEGAREKLLTTVLLGDVERVYRKVSEYIEQHSSHAYGFSASLLLPERMDHSDKIHVNAQNLPFAQISITTLKHLGYKELATRLTQQINFQLRWGTKEVGIPAGYDSSLFVGRVEELKIALEWCNGLRRLLVISGLPKIGKSWFIQHFRETLINHHSNRYKVYYFDIYDYTEEGKIADFPQFVADFFSTLAKDCPQITPSLTDFEKDYRSVLSQIGDWLHQAYPDLKNILIFDNVNKLTKEGWLQFELKMLDNVSRSEHLFFAITLRDPFRVNLYPLRFEETRLLLKELTNKEGVEQLQKLLKQDIPLPPNLTYTHPGINRFLYEEKFFYQQQPITEELIKKILKKLEIHVHTDKEIDQIIKWLGQIIQKFPKEWSQSDLELIWPDLSPSETRERIFSLTTHWLIEPLRPPVYQIVPSLAAFLICLSNKNN